MGDLAVFNVSLAAASAMFFYSPWRNSDVTIGWNASYTGSTEWPLGIDRVSGKGIGYHRSQLAGASLNVTIDGVALYLCITDGGATYSAILDGAHSATLLPGSAACSNYSAETTLAFEGLPFATHTAVLQLTTAGPNTAFQFFGGLATIAANVPAVAAPLFIDDTDSAWKWSPGYGPNVNPGWHPGTSDPGYNHTTTYTGFYDPSSTASYTFTNAVAFYVLGYMFVDTHHFQVSLDGVTTSMDMSTSWEEGSNIMFMASNLDPQQSHTVTVINYDLSHTTCNAGLCDVTMDALVLFNVAPENTSTTGASQHSSSTPGSSSLQASPKSSVTSSSPGTEASTSAGGAPVSGAVRSHSPNVGAIAGGILAAAVLVTGFVLLAVVIRRRSRRGVQSMGPIRVESGHGGAASAMRHSTAPQTQAYPWTPSLVAPITGRDAKRIPRHAPPVSSLPTDLSVSTPSTQQVSPAVLEQVWEFMAQRMDGANQDAARLRDASLPRYPGT